MRGTDGHLYQTTWDGVPGSAGRRWAPCGDIVVGAPGRLTSRQLPSPGDGRGTDDRAYAFYPSDPIGSAVADFVAARADNVTAAVFDITTGRTFTFRPGVVEHTASTVKVDILGTLLTQAQAAGRSLTPEEQSLAVPMIEESLDSAANALWVRLGPAAVGALRAGGRADPDGAGNQRDLGYHDDHRTGPHRHDPPAGLPESAADRRVPRLHAQPHGAHHSSPGMGHHRRGPAGVTVALKNGFSIINGWQINSMGWVNGQGRNYLIAVLTDGNPTEDYGIQTINAMSAIVWNGLGP